MHDDDPTSETPRPRRTGTMKLAAAFALTFAAGFVLGAAAIHRPMPGVPIELPPVRKPWNPKDVAGLLGSIGIRALGDDLESLPLVVAETDKSFAISVPASKNWLHYVIVPKKDVRDIGSVSTQDEGYLADVFLVARRLIEQGQLRDYRFYTNGPGLQAVAYLHFHLVAKRPRAL